MDRERLVTLLTHAASQLLGRGAQHGFTVHAGCRNHEETWHVVPEEVVLLATAVQPILSGGPDVALLAVALTVLFSPEEVQILDAIGDGEITGPSIARRLHVDHSTRLKLLLSNLASRGVLITGRNGYRLGNAGLGELLRRVNTHATRLLSQTTPNED